MTDFREAWLDATLIDYRKHRDALLNSNLGQDAKVYFNSKLTFDFNQKVLLIAGTFISHKRQTALWDKYSELISETDILLKGE